MKHEILYQPSYSLAVVSLEQGESIMAESGAMVSMSPTVKVEAKAAGGSFFGAIKSAVGASRSSAPPSARNRVRARSPSRPRPRGT